MSGHLLASKVRSLAALEHAIELLDALWQAGLHVLLLQLILAGIVKLADKTEPKVSKAKYAQSHLRGQDRRLLRNHYASPTLRSGRNTQYKVVTPQQHL